jgi:hypothetical protein
MSTVHRNHPTDEALAAFLDGRTTAEERARVIAHAADCSRCAELIAEAARSLAPDQQHRVTAFPAAASRPRARTWAAAAALIAATALGIAARYLAPGDARSRALVAVFHDPARAAALTRSSPLDGGSGLAFGSGAPRTEIAAFRAGAAAVDVQAALIGGDEAAAQRAARRSALIARWLPDQQSRPAQLRRALRAAERAVADAGADAETAAAWGRWVAAGRLAAASGDRAFLSSGVFRAARPESAPPSSDTQAADRALAALDRSLAELGSGGSLDEVAAAFERLLLLAS